MKYVCISFSFLIKILKFQYSVGLKTFTALLSFFNHIFFFLVKTNDEIVPAKLQA